MQTAVIIATSRQRWRMLLQVALPSVLSQPLGPDERRDVLVVDDHENEDEFRITASRVNECAGDLPEGVTLACVRNTRTRGVSGTGAWNTGIGLLAERHSQAPCYVAFLDDDDEYLPDHLPRCVRSIGPDVAAVLEDTLRVSTAGEELQVLESSALRPEAFFLGNPGVQTSNLFVRLDVLMAIQGFDETLHSATDRDLMIRLLRFCSIEHQRCHCTGHVGVRHNALDHPRVGNTTHRKHAGLDAFYRKHQGDFDPTLRGLSLARAKALFGYAREGR